MYPEKISVVPCDEKAKFTEFHDIKVVMGAMANFSKEFFNLSELFHYPRISQD